MDLQTMRKVKTSLSDAMLIINDFLKQNCSCQRYLNRDQFLSDLNQVVENSITYNGPSSPYTQTAEAMREVGMQVLQQVASSPYLCAP